MTNEFYQDIFETAFSKIQRLIDPSKSFDYTQIIKGHLLVDIMDDEYKNQHFVLMQAQKVLVDAIHNVIIKLLQKNNIKYWILPDDKKMELENIAYSASLYKRNKTKPFFTLFEEKDFYSMFSIKIQHHNKTTVYIFKDFGFPSTSVLLFQQAILNHTKADDSKFIIYVDDYAYACVLNHNHDTNDHSKGTNMYSLKYFFSEIFTEEEFNDFKKSYDMYLKKIKDYLSLSTIRRLSTNALHDFRISVLQSIQNHDFNEMVLSNTKISPSQKQIIDEQFFNNEYFKAICGNTEFAKSFITAEWLYSSIKSSAKILDLTYVILGYIKSVEQLMWHYVQLQSDTKCSDGSVRTIKPKRNKDIKYIPLSYKNIEDNAIDNSLGALKGFLSYYKNKDLFSNGIDSNTQSEIIKNIESFKDMRNEFLHKNNIYEWNEVEKVRNMTLLLIYFILGAYRYNDFKKDLSIINYTDRFLLLDYIYTHNKCVYFIDKYPDTPLLGITKRISYKTDGTPIYSELIFKNVNDRENKYGQEVFSESLPNTVHYVPLIPTEKGIDFYNPKTRIFENGRFCFNSKEDI